MSASTSTTSTRIDQTDFDQARSQLQSVSQFIAAVQSERDSLQGELARVSAMCDDLQKQLIARPRLSGGRLWFVDARGDDTADGTIRRPLRTISDATRRATAGDSVVVRAGVYRESIAIPTGRFAPDAPLTIVADSAGDVIVDGADVLRDWRVSSDGAGVYEHDWGHDFYIATNPDGSRKRFAGLPAPLGYCEQVMVEGAFLQPMLAGDELVEGSFKIDHATRRLLVMLPGRADARQVPVQASTRQRLVHGVGGRVTGVSLVGITFRHAANFAQRGAVVSDDGWVMEDCTVARVAGLGIAVEGRGVRLTRVVAHSNGQCGIGGSGSVDALLQGCTCRRNNTRGFSPTWEAGGGKFTRTRGLRIVDHLAEDNLGPGLWLDYDHHDYAITASRFARNAD